MGRGMIHKSHLRGHRFAWLVMAPLILCACDVDLFGFDQRRLVGDFWLHIWRGGHFTLEMAKKPKAGGCGVVGGGPSRIPVARARKGTHHRLVITDGSI